MRTFLTLSALFLLLSGNALAGGRYDACVKQEKALKAKVAKDCSGLRYLLDPSSCYKSQRELKEFGDGTCAAIGAPEQVEPAPQKPVPEAKDATAAQKPAAAAPPAVVPEKNSVSVIPAPVQKPVAPAPPQKPVVAAPPLQQVPIETSTELSCDQTRVENTRLKAENSRLRLENEQLRKAGH